MRLGSLGVRCQNSAEHLSSSPIVVEKASEPFTTLDVSALVRPAALFVDQFVADPLMIPLDVVVLHVFSHGVAQMSLSQRNDLCQALALVHNSD